MESSTIEQPATELGEQTHDSYAEQIKAEREAAHEAARPVAADDDGAALPADISVSGSSGQLSFGGIGGKKPEESKLRLTGGAFGVEGQFGKGEDVIVEVKARIGEVKFTDTVDSATGQATACTRGHSARVLGAVVVPAGTIARLDALTLAVQEYLAGDISREALAEQVEG